MVMILLSLIIPRRQKLRTTASYEMLLLNVLFALFEQNSNEHYEMIIQILIFTMTVWYLFDTQELSFKEKRLLWERCCNKQPQLC
jgi:hypothetical protein